MAACPLVLIQISRDMRPEAFDYPMNLHIQGSEGETFSIWFKSWYLIHPQLYIDIGGIASYNNTST